MMDRVYGVVLSRRLGRSLGVSPVPFKVCTYCCVYCQVGKTTLLTTSRQLFFPVDSILKELEAYIKCAPTSFDVVSIVGEGEPTLYSELGTLIKAIKRMTDKPVVLITNGALLFREDVAKESSYADIVMPSLDAWDEKSFRHINRPAPELSFREVFRGIKAFRKAYKGVFYLEVMCVGGITDADRISERVAELSPDKVFINTPKRPPTEPWVKPCGRELKVLMERFKVEKSPELPGYYYSSLEKDPIAALVAIVKRHPMTYEEALTFVKSKGATEETLQKAVKSGLLERVSYEGTTFLRYGPPSPT